MINKWSDLNFIPDWNNFILHEDRLKFLHAENAYCRTENDAFSAAISDETRKAVLDKRRAFLIEVVKYQKHDIRLKPQTSLKPIK